VPVLTILTQVANAFDDFVLLVQKSKFCAETKVAYTEETYFFKDVLSGQLNNKSIWWKKVLERQGGNLHDVADVETVNPFVLV
jgi:hypothetical protein